MGDQRGLREGFTLVELMITMTIVGILAMVVWLRIDNAYADAYRSAVQSDLRTLALSQELYHQQHMTYADVPVLNYTPSDGVVVTVTAASGLGFAANATHRGLPNETCAFFTGTVPDGSGDPAEEPGLVTCD